MEKQTNNLPQSQSVTAVNFFDPAQFEIAQRMSMMFASSQLVPDTYQAAKVGKEQAIANCVIALDIATRMGASPLMVMQNLVIIYGRPSWSSTFLISTVNACGRFEPLQYRFTEKGRMGKFNYTEYVKTWVPGKPGSKGYYKNEATVKEFDGTKIMDLECVAYTTARGGKTILEGSPVSLRMAVDEGWYTKAGSKWRTMPKQMLMYRAASFWVRVYAPELSMGIRTVEEMQDIVDITDTAVDVSAPAAPMEPKDMSQGAATEEIGFEDETLTDASDTPNAENSAPNAENSAPNAENSAPDTDDASDAPNDLFQDAPSY